MFALKKIPEADGPPRGEGPKPMRRQRCRGVRPPEKGRYTDGALHIRHSRQPQGDVTSEHVGREPL
jgi:hypothetical protein